MNAKKLNEKLEKVQSSVMKRSNVLSEMTVEGAKNLTQVHTSLANHAAKNMQLAAINLMTAKTPSEVWGAIKGDGGTPFIEGWQQYQHSIAETIDRYVEECSEANEEIYKNSKDSVNEFFNLVYQNTPDGTDALVKPYHSAVNVALEGVDQMNSLIKSYIHSLENSLSGGGIFGNITDLMPATHQHKYSKRSQSVEKAL